MFFRITILLFLFTSNFLMSAEKVQEVFELASGTRYQLSFEALTAEKSDWKLQITDDHKRKLLDGHFHEFYQVLRPGGWEKYRQIFYVPKDGTTLHFKVNDTVEMRNVKLEKVPNERLNPNPDFAYGLNDFTCYGKSKKIEIVETEKGQRVIKINPRGSIVTDPIPVKGIRTLWIPRFYPCSMHIAFLDDDMCFVGELVWQGNASFHIPDNASWLIASVCRTSGDINTPVTVVPIVFLRKDPKK